MGETGHLPTEGPQMKRRSKRPSPLARPAGPSRKRPPAPGRPQVEPARSGRATQAKPPAASPPARQRSKATGVPAVTPQVAPPEVLARAAVEIADRVEQAVFADGRRADRTLASLLRARRDLSPPDARFVSNATFALL